MHQNLTFDKDDWKISQLLIDKLALRLNLSLSRQLSLLDAQVQMISIGIMPAGSLESRDASEIWGPQRVMTRLCLGTYQR